MNKLLDQKENANFLKHEFPCQFRKFKLGNYSLNYVDEGHGPTLLMLHACPMWSFEFRHLILSLRNRYRIIAIDQLGFGLSDKPANADYHIENHVDHVDRFVHDLHLQNVTLICHGRGTAIGMAFAIRRPDMIKGFILLDSMSLSSFQLPFRLQICRLPYVGAKLIHWLNIFGWDERTLPPNIRLGYTLPFPDTPSKVAFSKFIDDLPSAPEEASARTMLETEVALWLLNEKPSCIIWGMKDWLYTPIDLQYWKKAFPNAEVYQIANAGRHLLEEEKECINDIVSKFLDTNILHKIN